MGSPFRASLMLLAAVDLPFRLLVPSGNASNVGSYVRFNLEKIWPMCSWRLLLPILVEHTAPLLRFPCSWSLLLVGTVVLGSRSGVLPWL